MTPMKLDVLVACLAYGGNGGIATILPDIAFWLAKTAVAVHKDDRVGRFEFKQFGDIPLTMARNSIVKYANDHEFDVIVMIDSDNHPDLYLGKDTASLPFWDTSFNFLYERRMRGVPTVVCAPYCGPPPHPTEGGMENVYVFHAEETETDVMKNGGCNFHVIAYDRNTAAKMRGIQQIAAGPTGVIMYSTDAFDVMPVHQKTKGDILDEFQAGTLTKERTLRLLSMESWFFYEYTDQYQTNKASTEDVTNTREIQMAGIEKFKEPLVFCNWDAWAGHHKPKCVGKPTPLTMEQINPSYIEAVLSGSSNATQIRDIDYSANIPEELVGKTLKADVEPEEEFGDSTVSDEYDELALNTIQGLTDLRASEVPDGPLRVMVVDAKSGSLPMAIRGGFRRAGGDVFCIGTMSDEDLDRFGLKCGGDPSIKIVPAEPEDFLDESEPASVDMIVLCHPDVHAKPWLRHLAPNGILCTTYAPLHHEVGMGDIDTASGVRWTRRLTSNNGSEHEEGTASAAEPVLADGGHATGE